MLVQGIKSKLITPGDSLFDVLAASLRKRKLKEKTVIVISSKVAAVTQGRVVKIGSNKEFKKLVAGEADIVIERSGNTPNGKEQQSVTLTLKEGVFTPWAGIDRSNINKGEAVLWPENAAKEAEDIAKMVMRKYGLKKIGVVISDSFCAPLRKGVTAVAIGHFGFNGVNELRGEKDLYGNRLTVSRQAVADMLASAAHLVMGESSESTPFALVEDAPVRFAQTSGGLVMDAKECLYYPLYNKKIIASGVDKRK